MNATSSLVERMALPRMQRTISLDELKDMLIHSSSLACRSCSPPYSSSVKHSSIDFTATPSKPIQISNNRSNRATYLEKCSPSITNAPVPALPTSPIKRVTSEYQLPQRRSSFTPDKFRSSRLSMNGHLWGGNNRSDFFNCSEEDESDVFSSVAHLELMPEDETAPAPAPAPQFVEENLIVSRYERLPQVHDELELVKPMDTGSSSLTYLVHSKNSELLMVFKPHDGEPYLSSDKENDFENENRVEIMSASPTTNIAPSLIKSSNQDSNCDADSVLCQAIDQNKNVKKLSTPQARHVYSPPIESRLAIKKGFVYGDTTIKEVAAYLMDHERFAGVPATFAGSILLQRNLLPTARLLAAGDVEPARPSPSERSAELIKAFGSLQEFKDSIGSAEDLGSSMFSIDDVHHIGILDLRLLNCDRHTNNILVHKITNDDGSVSHKLIPIDHGFTLPSYKDLSEVRLEWSFWKQCREPFSTDSLNYIRNLNPVKDAIDLFRIGVRDESLVSMVFSSVLLMRAAEAGLTLGDIAMMVQRQNGGDDPSVLEHIVALSIQRFKVEEAVEERSKEAQICVVTSPNMSGFAGSLETDYDTEHMRCSSSTSEASTDFLLDPLSCSHSMSFNEEFVVAGTPPAEVSLFTAPSITEASFSLQHDNESRQLLAPRNDNYLSEKKGVVDQHMMENVHEMLASPLVSGSSSLRRLLEHITFVVDEKIALHSSSQSFPAVPTVPRYVPPHLRKRSGLSQALASEADAATVASGESLEVSKRESRIFIPAKKFVANILDGAMF